MSALRTIFHFCISKKRLSTASLQVSTKYFQNRILKYSVWNYDILCQHWEQHISKQNYEITVTSTGYSYLQINTTKMAPFLKYIFGIWDRGLANS
jgi:hypothetical protein